MNMRTTWTDTGIYSVHEFHVTFGCHIGNPDDPVIPLADNEANIKILGYARLAKDLSVELNYAAKKAKEVGDQGGALLLIRLQLIQEELAELAEAMADRDIVEAFDALVDLTYVLDGTYITLGLHQLKLAGLAEVHRSNMSKLDDEGNPIISESGRVEKGENYSPPDLLRIIKDYTRGPEL